MLMYSHEVNWRYCYIFFSLKILNNIIAIYITILKLTQNITID